MVIDAILAYLHFTAIFLLFAFMTVEVMLTPTLSARSATAERSGSADDVASAAVFDCTACGGGAAKVDSVAENRPATTKPNTTPPSRSEQSSSVFFMGSRSRVRRPRSASRRRPARSWAR